MSLFKHLIDFLYPPFCIHCEAQLSADEVNFCTFCFQDLKVIEPSDRCPHCFSPEITRQKEVCAKCRETHPLWNFAAAAFDYQGPAASLIREMKYSNQPYLSKGLAAFMAIQFVSLKWPTPDIIVPVPVTFFRFLQRGYNQSALIAEELGKILNVPVCKSLKRRSGDFSQAMLSSKERRSLGNSTFYLAHKGVLSDKVVLLVDDVMTTGTTLSRSTEILLDEFPEAIYVLTGCLANH